MSRPCLVITSIAEANALDGLAAGARRAGFDFIVVGDEASPEWYHLEGCDFYNLQRQERLDLQLATACPVRHYARKNIGYLLAMSRGATVIVETDDDTVAYESFWAPPSRARAANRAPGSGWVNVFGYFTDAPIWPRGLPLDEVRRPAPPLEELPPETIESPIHQGLIDDDPDVDAVYRLLVGTPVRFREGPGVALSAGAWCPFNSQNTTWWPEAFPLMYLPATCSFRMTDIWRSFVAQRIAWENGWRVVFHAATISQSRNVHDLMRDFRDEVPGYLGNRAIRETLEELDLRPGLEHLPANLREAYEALVARSFLEPAELVLLDAWLADVAAVMPSRAGASASR